jgi:hypothetical protein
MTAGWSWGGAARSLVIACIAVGSGAGLGYRIAHERPPEDGRAIPHRSATSPAPTAPPPLPAAAGSGSAPSGGSRPPTPAELAIVAPLSAGSHLDGWTVTSIHGTHAGRLAILLAEDAQPSFVLEVQLHLASPSAPTAPETAGPYALYYRGSRFDPAVARALAAVAAIARKNAVPPPPGLTAYSPN